MAKEDKTQHFYDSMAYAGIGIVMSCAVFLLVYQVYWAEIGESPTQNQLYLAIAHAITGGASLIFILYESLMIRAMQRLIDSGHSDVKDMPRVHISLRWLTYSAWLVGSFFLAENGLFFACLWLTVIAIVEMAFETLKSSLRQSISVNEMLYDNNNQDQRGM